MSGKIKNITEQRFGRLIAVSVDKEKSSHGNTYWNCLCDCGNRKSVIISALTRGATRSCGCLHLEIAYANGYRPKSHGLSKHRLYKIWSGMIERYENSQNSAYIRYGNRNIKVCEKWRTNFIEFYNWSMTNGYDANLTIDRIDGTKGYSAENCRWASAKQQANNTKSNTLITYNGETHTLSEWADILGIKARTLRNRITELGWNNEKALTTPIMTTLESTRTANKKRHMKYYETV